MINGSRHVPNFTAASVNISLPSAAVLLNYFLSSMGALQQSTGQISFYTNPIGTTRHYGHFWEPADFASSIHRSGPSFSCKSDRILSSCVSTIHISVHAPKESMCEGPVVQPQCKTASRPEPCSLKVMSVCVKDSASLSDSCIQ